MARVVILEGPDGGGKTSLARKLAGIGFEYRHEGPPPSGVDLVAHYLKSLNDSLISNKNIVHDRLWLGERIYGPVARGLDRLGEKGQTLFERLHRSKAITQYICLPSIGVARVNYSVKIKEKDDVLKSMEKWENVFKGYSDWIEKHGSVGELYDYKIDPFDKIKKDVMSFSRALTHLPTGTIGSHTAKYLFIGDRPNHLSIDVPFFSTVGYSGYLNNALKLLNIHEEDLAFSNAFSPTGQSHILYNTLSRLPNVRYIFLMGGETRDWFYRGISHERAESAYIVRNIHHPSYIKRFRGNNPQVMADLISQELK